ncbi:MAG: Ig-like domain-containing protein [Gemmatimonadaceae bacterium]|nr:Ig-like domain-containing protein [Gemmatimonadaceae bacterium]
MKRGWHATYLLLALAACASPGMPPGGPPDSDVPVIRRITPDSNATNVSADEVLIFFDEVISERPGGAGAAAAGSIADLSAIVTISPSDGRDRVTWRRTAIELKPRRGFRANTAYRVTILPGVVDLRGNVLGERTEFVFSTGPDIPTGEVRGAVFDFAEGRAAPLARVEVFPPSDSTFRWTARADSTGRFVVRDLGPGTYRVRAWIDANGDRAVGRNEAVDTTTVTLETTASADLYAFVRDTMAPQLERVTVQDSTVLLLRFNRAVAGDWAAGAAVQLLRADSSVVTLGGVPMPATRFDSLARAAAPADTAAADTTAAAPANAQAAAPGQAAAAAADSAATTVRAPTFARIRPSQEWKVRLAAPLEPGDYRLKVSGAPGLNGLAWPSDRSFKIDAPKPAEPSETPPETPPAQP